MEILQHFFNSVTVIRHVVHGNTKLFADLFESSRVEMAVLMRALGRPCETRLASVAVD